MAVEAGLDIETDQSGTVGGAIGNGWMKLEGALDGDAGVVASVRREDDDLIDALARVLEVGLPLEAEEVVRAIAARLAEGLERLDRLPRHREKGRK